MLSALFPFLGATALARHSQQAMLDKIKLKLFDLKGSIDDLSERTKPEDYALRIVRCKNYKGRPHFFGRVDLPRADLLMSESAKEDFGLFFVIGPIIDFTGPEDPRLIEEAMSILKAKVRRYREKAMMDYLFK